MPKIDVTDVLTDPDFADALMVTSSARIIQDNGRASDMALGQTNVVAVVVPAPQRLILQSDGALRDGAIEIYTTYTLTGGVKVDDASGRQPDVVTWHGREYVVASVEDFSAFGAGFIHATANLQNINPTA